MYEPKYKLNKKDAARYRELLFRHCLEAPLREVGGKLVPNKPNPKYPPLTPQENAEFERLHEKERRKIESHPAMKRSLRRQRYMMAKTEKIFQKVKRLLRKMERNAVIKN